MRLSRMSFNKGLYLKLLAGSLTFSDNILSYYGKNPCSGPLFIGWDVTSMCNSRCCYCNRWSAQEKKQAKELNTEQAIRIISELGKCGVKFLTFSGGEPLLRKDIFMLIQEAKKNRMYVNISTNGSLLSKYAQSIVDSGVDSVTISVASYKSELHDNAVGMKGSFNKILDGIALLKKFRARKLRTGKSRARKNRPAIKIRTLASKRNISELSKTIGFWNPRVDEVLLQPIHESSRIGFINPPDLNQLDIHIPDNLDAHAETPRHSTSHYSKKEFITMLKKHHLNNSFNRGVWSFLFDKNSLKKKTRCFAGFFFGEIDYDGSLYSCSDHYVSIGNLKKESFKQLWLGSKAKNLRITIKKNKNDCFCWYTCSSLNIMLSKVLL